MSKRIAVAAFDRQPLFLAGISAVMHEHAEFTLLATGVCVEDIVKTDLESGLAVVIVDGDLDGFSVGLIQEVLKKPSAVRVLVTSGNKSVDAVSAAIGAGASGYFLKTESIQSLLQAIRSIANSETYVTPALAAALFARMKNKDTKARIKPSLTALTARETEILYCVGLGLSNKEIGLKLELSEKTVKHYMTSIFQKLNVSNRVQAALLANQMETRVSGASAMNRELHPVA